MPLSFRGLFVCVPFLRLQVNNAVQNPGGVWEADFAAPGNFLTIDGFTTIGTAIAWATVPGGLGAPDPADGNRYRFDLGAAANVVPHPGIITVTATVPGVPPRNVTIAVRPRIAALNIVPNHLTFQDAAGANYAVDLTGIAVDPPPGMITSNVQVNTVPATAAALSQVAWAGVDTQHGGAAYALTNVDASTRGIPLDGLKTIQVSVGVPGGQAAPPPPQTVGVAAPVAAANLGNGLSVELHRFSYAGANRFDVIREDAAHFNMAYSAVWDRAHRNRPQAYPANTPLTLNGVTLQVTGIPAVAFPTVYVRASAYFLRPGLPPVVLQATSGAQAIAPLAPVGTHVAMGNLALGNTPNLVSNNDPLLIFWEVSTDNVHWHALELTGNQVYVTRVAPVASTLPWLNTAAGPVYAYDSLLSMSCKAAAGQINAGNVRDAIAGLFAPSDPNPRVVRLNRAAGGPPTQLSYWQNHLLGAAPAQTLNGAGVAGNMFTNAAGNLACGVWAELLMAMWALHGKGDGRMVQVVVRQPGLPGPPLAPTPGVVAGGDFLVRNWSFNNPPNYQANNYTHAGLPAIAAGPVANGPVDQAAPINNGVAGQNNANPPVSFTNHYIVRDGGGANFVDPSYGTQAMTRDNWADASIAGLWNGTTPQPLGFVMVNPALPNNLQANRAAVALFDMFAGTWVP